MLKYLVGMKLLPLLAVFRLTVRNKSFWIELVKLIKNKKKNSPVFCFFQAIQGGTWGENKGFLKNRGSNKGELPKAVFLYPPVFLCARCGAAAPRLSRPSMAGETAFFVGSAAGIRPPQPFSPCCSSGKPVSLAVPPSHTGLSGRIW